MWPRCFAALVVCTIVAVPHAWGQAKSEQPRRVSALWDDLQRPMSVARYQREMTLGEALQALRQDFQARHGAELPLFIDTQPFKDENPDAPDWAAVTVRLPDVPRERTAAQVLRALMAQIPTQNATLFVKPGVVEITTQSRLVPATLLQQQVDLRFERQPLSFVLDEIYEQTGVYVALDPRIGMRARTQITLRWANDMTLGTGLYLIAQMSNLALVVDDNALFLTTPAGAHAYWQEKTRLMLGY